MPISQQYLHPVRTVSPEASAREAARLMKEHGVGALVVTDGDGRPVAIVTDRDVALGVLPRERDAAEVRVSELMSEGLVAVRATDELTTAVEVIRRELVRRVPVVDEDGTLVGIVTADDLMAQFGDQLAWAVEATRAGFDHEAAPPESRRSPLGRE